MITAENAEMTPQRHERENPRSEIQIPHLELNGVGFRAPRTNVQLSVFRVLSGHNKPLLFVSSR